MLGNPGGDGLEEGALVGVDGAVALDRDVEHEVAVLADDVDERVDDGDGRLVAVVGEEGEFVVPVADAGVGLPGVGLDAVGLAALDVEGEGADVLGFDVLGGEDDIDLAFVADAGVVVVGGDVEAVLAEGKLGVVEVEEVRLVGVDQVLAAEEPVVGEVRAPRAGAPRASLRRLAAWNLLASAMVLMPSGMTRLRPV